MCFFRKKLKPSGTIGIVELSSLLLDKLEEIGDDKAEIYLPDSNMKIYSKDSVVSYCKLMFVNFLTFSAEEHDCDDFAAELFGDFAGLIWTNKHALNWFSDGEVIWFIEPQTGKISANLEDWQGWDVRFFVGR